MTASLTAGPPPNHTPLWRLVLLALPLVLIWGRILAAVLTGEWHR